MHVSWDKFKLVIHKSVKACENSKIASSDYFSQLGKKIKIGLGIEACPPNCDRFLDYYD